MLKKKSGPDSIMAFTSSTFENEQTLVSTPRDSNTNVNDLILQCQDLLNNTKDYQR